MAWPTLLAAPDSAPPEPEPEPDPLEPEPEPPEPEPDPADFAPPDMSAVLSFRPDAWAIAASAGTAFWVAPCQRALLAADVLVPVCEIGPLVGVARLVIGRWLSHGAVSL